MIRPPDKAQIICQDTTRLFWGTQDGSDDFYIRCAVAWPNPLIHAPGMAILGAECIRDKRVYIFEDYEFRAIEPLFDLKVQRYRGFAEFVNLMAATYFCSDFFFHEDPNTHSLYFRQCFEQAPGKPSTIQAPDRLHFTEISNLKEDQLDAVMQHYLTAPGEDGTKLLRIGRQSKLMEHLVTKDPEHYRGIHALRVLLTGFRRFPWVDQRYQQREIEYKWW